MTIAAWVFLLFLFEMEIRTFSTDPARLINRIIIHSSRIACYCILGYSIDSDNMNWLGFSKAALWLTILCGLELNLRTKLRGGVVAPWINHFNRSKFLLYLGLVITIIYQGIEGSWILVLIEFLLIAAFARIERNIAKLNK